MEILQTDVHQRPEFLFDDGPREEGGGQPDRQVHRLRDVQRLAGGRARQRVLQGFVPVAQAAAGFAGRLDRIHESHLRHDDALAAAHGTGTRAVERKVGFLHLVRPGEGLADVAGDVHIGAGRGTQADADVLLADIDHFVRFGVLLPETFHQRTLARAGHTRHHAEDAQREIDAEVPQVVQGGVFHPEHAVPGPRRCLERQPFFHQLSRGRSAPEQSVERSFEQDPAAVDPRSGAEVHNVVGDADHLRMVLHQQDGVAPVAQPADRAFQPLDVARMQPHAGLVQDIEHVREG